MDISVGRIVCRNPFNESIAVSPHRTPTHCCILHLLCYRSIRASQPLPYVNHAAKKTTLKRASRNRFLLQPTNIFMKNAFPSFASLLTLPMPATYRTVLQRGLPLESVGWRVFSPANGSLENASDRCIMFDQLPVFVSTQLDLNWKWLHVGLMMQLLAVDRSTLQWRSASHSPYIGGTGDQAYRCRVEALAEPCEVEDEPSLANLCC
jgi:hypothetical protein